MNCFNCGKPGQFARDCIESKVLYDKTHYSSAYVSSCLMLVETVSYWIVDSVATDPKRGTEMPSWIFIEFQKEVELSTWGIIALLS